MDSSQLRQQPSKIFAAHKELSSDMVTGKVVSRVLA